MDPREQFFTDEFYRYSAECRRLGRLVRRPSIETSRGFHAALVRAVIERIAELQRRIIDRPAHRLVPRAVRARR